MTHLEMLERGLRIVEAEPGGKDSKYAQDLKGQIAAAKFQQEQMQTSSQPERFLGGTLASSSAPNDDPMAPAVTGMEAALERMYRAGNPEPAQ